MLDRGHESVSDVCIFGQVCLKIRLIVKKWVSYSNPLTQLAFYHLKPCLEVLLVSEKAGQAHVTEYMTTVTVYQAMSRVHTQVTLSNSDPSCPVWSLTTAAVHFHQHHTGSVRHLYLTVVGGYVGVYTSTALNGQDHWPPGSLRRGWNSQMIT